MSLHLNWFHLCLPQSEDDFLEESDFDDISIHSASVLSDALGATTKKKTKCGRKKKKSMFIVYTCWCFLCCLKTLLSYYCTLCFFSLHRGGWWWIWDWPSGLLWGLPAGWGNHPVWHLSQSISPGLSGPWTGESSRGQMELSTLCE